MKPGTFTVKGGGRIIALGCLFGLMAAPSVLAIPLPPPPGLGAKVIAIGGPVTFRVVPTDADFTSDIYFVECVTGGDCVYFILGTSHVGEETTLGGFEEGAEIDLHIIVQETKSEFRTGPASHNPTDGIVHALLKKIDAATLEVGFEDLLEGGDRDFNDVILEIEGARMSVPFSGLPLSPSAGSNLSFGQQGELQVLPILAGDESGVSISLGETDGWQGTIDFDGRAPNAQLAYAAQSAPGSPDFVVQHKTSPDGGRTDLELIFPRALQTSPLQVDAFLGGQKVASTQVQSVQGDHALTFAPVSYLEARKVKKVKVKKTTIPTPIGPITIEGIEIVFGLTSGEIEGIGDLDFDTLAFTFSDEGFPGSDFSEVTLHGFNAPLTIETQSVSMFDQFHSALGGAVLETRDGALTVVGDDGFANHPRPGVAIDLGNAGSFDLAWKPFPLIGLTLSESFIEFNSRGTVGGVPDQDLGTLRVTQLTTGDSEAEVKADFSAVGSPTQRILIYDRGHLVADVAAHTGVAALTSAWPTGVGKGNTVLGSLRLPCYSLPFPEDTWILIPGGRWMTGDRVLVLAENPTAGVESVSQLSLRTTDLPPIKLTGEVITPIPDL